MNILRIGGSLLRPGRPHSYLHMRYAVSSRGFHATTSLLGIKSQILKDVGEGITEVQIIQWYVEEGAHIEEWKPLCQYQSDKAVDDITSRYEGVIKKLHFEADDTIPTGQALCDIEVDDKKYSGQSSSHTPATAPEGELAKSASESEVTTKVEVSEVLQPTLSHQDASIETPKSKHASLATPAVRGLLKTHNINIIDINGTGKEGRVMKEDVLNFAQARDSPITSTLASIPDKRQIETETKLTPIQSSMFKTMTRSLNIPHLLYADEFQVNNITTIRKRLASNMQDPRKLTLLPFVVKAVSLALNEYPILNSRIENSTPEKPKLIMRAKHNIGIAMDTPNGLFVPNIKDAASLSISDISDEIARLSSLGKAGKLTSTDLGGGTITISNIGNIGGTYVAPVIVPTEVAILGVGRTKSVPVFDEADQVVRGELVNFSWSADHRVIDGATMARMGGLVRSFIESPELMLLNLR
ncbi:Lipoamide Acyltransferase [Penicillium taxi]|uniref:Lipoamide Acyltransferase n=1 Tax=Penicillium taxi TaxID=168475 RepID=UPI00254520B4|nr:Lipoamide Acyltransferase [Penicillium taxi]KAJ5899077.1 Lipoamide Acyltransferase [Penicillium taxi]